MLHTVNKSPFERSSLDSCLRLAKKGSAILLFEDGVYGAMKNSKGAALLDGLKVSVLGPDLAARGIPEDRLVDGVTVVDYAGFVDLVEANDKVQSWL